MDGFEDRYDSLIQYYAEMHGVSWKLLKSQIHEESYFHPRAVSPVGAKGLAQFMDATWKEWGRGDPFDPEESITAQARYMDWLLRQFHGDAKLALAAYNWGVGHVKAMGFDQAPLAVQKYANDIVARIS